MSKVVVLVCRLVAEACKEKHNCIGDKVCKGVYGICYHSRRGAQHSGHKLEDDKQDIDYGAPNCYPEDLFFSLHKFFFLKQR